MAQTSDGRGRYDPSVLSALFRMLRVGKLAVVIVDEDAAVLAATG